MDSRAIAFLILAWVSLAGLYGRVIQALWRKKQAGTLLLTPGRDKIPIFVGIFSALLSIVLALQWLHSANHDVNRLIPALVLLGGGLDAVLGRLEIRKGGIVQGRRFYNWQSIASYSWREKKDKVQLVLKLRSGYFFRKERQFPISGIHKDAVDRELRLHIPGELLEGTPTQE